MRVVQRVVPIASAAGGEMNIDKQFIVNRQGKDFILYAGLIHEAHKRGLVSIETELVTCTASLALFKAVVTVAEEGQGARTFTGYGDATPENVGRNIVPHFIRMAETRAKARALRDALDVGAASLEELGDDDEPPRQQPRPIERVRAHFDLDDQQQETPAPAPAQRLSSEGTAAWRRASAIHEACRLAKVDAPEPSQAWDDKQLSDYAESWRAELTRAGRK